VSEEQSQTGRASVIQFIESLKSNKSFEHTRDRIRVVPKGLFVDERGADAVVAAFQGWIHRTTQGAADKTLDKTRQWLFETSEPERFYLVEGKQVLAGYLIPEPIQTPQRFGLPYYLGSLLPTAEYLHPSDPQLEGIKGLQIRQGKVGLEALISRRNKQVIVPEAVLKSFKQLAHVSRFLQRRYAGCDTSLLLSTCALAALARRARPVPKAFPVCVPYDVKISKTKELRAAGKFLFVEEKGVLLRVLELHGRGLSSFLRQELIRAPKDKLGSFRLTPKNRDLVGFYEIGGRRTAVHARAFGEFAELIRRAREPRERFTGWFSAAECFEKFSSLFQIAQPIERKKIAQSLDRFQIEGHSFRICGGWIFALSRDNTVLRTVARHIRLPGHKRTKE
jgi:hypothetical protein